MRSLRFTGAVAAALLATTTLATPARAAEPSGYTGVVRTEAGEPIQGACLALFRTETTVAAEFCTDADGRYTITGVPTDVTYKVRVQATGYRTRWWYDSPNYFNGESLWIPSSGVIEQDLTLGVGAGTIRGRITDELGAAADATVYVTPVDRYGEFRAYTWHLGDGRYEIDNVAPGQYRIYINDNRHGIQWVPQKDNREDADVFTVTDGGTVVVDEQWRPLGTVEVAVTDADTGAPVPHPCVYIRSTINDGTVCGADGLVRVTDVQPGDWEYSVSGGATYFGVDDGRRLRVGHGETVRLTAQLARGAAITTTIVDAATGQPVPAMCITLVVPTGLGQGAPGTRTCSDASGVLAIGPLTNSGRYQLYAKQSRNPSRPPPILYGDQWVTTNGGTGDQRQATIVTVTPKRTTAIPPIRVDRPGAIGGVIRDAATGAPVAGVCAYPFAYFGDSRSMERNCSNSQGQYTVNDLGPYDWPIEFTPNSGSGYAWQWAGGAADRFDARLTRVAAGQTAPLDAQLVKGGVLAGTVTNGSSVVDLGYVWSYNARTGDMASASFANIRRDGAFELRGHPSQSVYVRYWSETSGCWYGTAPDWVPRPARARPVTVTAGATTTIAMDMGRTCAPPPRL